MTSTVNSVLVERNTFFLFVMSIRSALKNSNGIHYYIISSNHLGHFASLKNHLGHFASLNKNHLRHSSHNAAHSFYLLSPFGAY